MPGNADMSMAEEAGPPFPPPKAYAQEAVSASHAHVSQAASTKMAPQDSSRHQWNTAAKEDDERDCSNPQAGVLALPALPKAHA